MIYVLKQGVVSEFGTHEVLMGNCGEYYALNAAQVGSPEGHARSRPFLLAWRLWQRV
jgi:hypothetical protein